MNCCTALSLPEHGVAAVAGVQAFVYAGLKCNGCYSHAVAGVAATPTNDPPATAATSVETVPLQRKPNAHAGCTPATSETSTFNDVGQAVVATHHEGDAP